MTKSKTMGVLTSFQRSLDPNQQPVYFEGVASRTSEVPKRQDIREIYEAIVAKHKGNDIRTESNPNKEITIEELGKLNPYIVF